MANTAMQFKRAFNAMLNAKKLPNPVPEFSSQETGLTWKQFTNAIIDYHKPLQSLMNSGEGVTLQKWDSDIPEAIVPKFVKMSQPCLPIHDSFITNKTLESELPDINCKQMLHPQQGTLKKGLHRSWLNRTDELTYAKLRP